MKYLRKFFGMFNRNRVYVGPVVRLSASRWQNKACDCCQECVDMGCGEQCSSDCSCDDHN